MLLEQCNPFIHSFSYQISISMFFSWQRHKRDSQKTQEAFSKTCFKAFWFLQIKCMARQVEPA